MRRLESDGLREGRGGGVFLTQLQQCQPEIEGDLHGVGRERLCHPKRVGRLGKAPQRMKRRGTMEMRFGQARIDRRRALEGSERRLKIAGILQRLAERAPSFDMPWITRNQRPQQGGGARIA
jgi:hypothetical protein